MRKIHWLVTATLVAAVSACVTINVYFPAAAAEKAAAEFIDEVLGDAPTAPAQAPEQAPPRGDRLGAVFSPIGVAHAQADIDIESPQVRAIQSRMAERFRTTLEPHFASGALGFTRDGRVEVRDAAAVPLAARTAVRQAVAEDNRDRDAVYREIAVANGHPEWEAQIRETFAAQWIERAAPGWYYQDASGTWQRK
ncbi:MAG TPA: YdbL family protein [Candidatus Saccharimonadia bacterium]|nr:YdbL family protein [Candidatus Saccharimonadia bacterium]